MHLRNFAVLRVVFRTIAHVRMNQIKLHFRRPQIYVSFENTIFKLQKNHVFKILNICTSLILNILVLSDYFYSSTALGAFELSSYLLGGTYFAGTSKVCKCTQLLGTDSRDLGGDKTGQCSDSSVTLNAFFYTFCISGNFISKIFCFSNFLTGKGQDGVERRADIWTDRLGE